MGRILVAGETLIDFIPEGSGPLAAVERFARRAGGAPANVAVGLSRLGRTPWFWTRIGDDPFGDFLAETLGKHGIPDRFVRRDPEAPTALAFVSAGDDDPGFTFYRDGTADTRMEAGTVPDAALDRAEWIYVGGVPLSAEPSRFAVFDLLERTDDSTVVFDPNARPELWSAFNFAATVDRVLEHADVVKTTPGDLRGAGYEGDPEELARAVSERGPHTVLVTLGAEGAYARATEAAPWGPAEIVNESYAVEAIDTTGAGDAFTAGAITALADGETLPEALSFANAVAAVSTTAEGAMAALPDRESVSAFRASR